MSTRQIVLDPDLLRLQNEGYEVEVQNGHLLVHSVPYVNAAKQVMRGIVVTNLNGNVGATAPPRDHQVWFAGDYPCRHTGAPIETIRHSSKTFDLWPGFTVHHRFSNKPATGYPDFYTKMKTYISIISNEARRIDPDATPCTFNVLISNEQDTVFRYWDTASSRTNTLSVSAKLTKKKVGIIGLGGTGSYVLDFVAKTPIENIHIYDGDVYSQHNAFRAPGGTSVETLEAKLYKVDHYFRQYNVMRTGVVPHQCYVSEENLGELDDFDFIFLCVDKGAARKLIGEYLREKGVPFIDVGMELSIEPEGDSILGTCRVTLCTSEKNDHFERRTYLGKDDGDDLYEKNIQVAEINALNASLAVLKWKQYCGYYQDIVKAHNTTYSINSHSLTRDEMTGVTEISE